MDHRNTGAKNIRWGLPVQGLPRSGICFPGYSIQLGLGYIGEIRAFGTILSQPAIRVLVAASLPRARRVTEIYFHSGSNGKLRVIGKLGSSVPG
jgi:hypothetical protein